MNFNKKFTAVVLLSGCLAFSACTMSRVVPLEPRPSPAQVALEQGRRAVIVLRSGGEIRGTLVAADEMGITVRTSSDSIQGIAFEDMESLEVNRVSMQRTAAAIGGVLAVSAGALYLLWKSTYSKSD